MVGLVGDLDRLAYSVDQAAAVASISRRQLYRHLAAGRLRAAKDGKRTVILRRELVRFLRSLPAYDSRRGAA